MYDRLTFQRREHHRYCYAVICAQSSAIGVHPVSVHNDTDRLCEHVDALVRLTGKDHVDVSLKGNGLGVLTARRGLLGNDNVIRFILYIGKPSLPGKLGEIIADRLRMMGSAGDRRDLPEIVKYPFGIRFDSVLSRCRHRLYSISGLFRFSSGRSSPHRFTGFPE